MILLKPHWGICTTMASGVPKDLAVAARWYRKAADQGAMTSAQVMLG